MASTLCGGQVGVQLRQRVVGRIGQQLAVAAQVAGLAQVVGLVVQLALGIAQQGLDVHLLGHQAGHAEQRGHVVHIAVNALHARRGTGS
jgi:ribosomal protein S18 acetylase RimI-like enzyme